LLPLGIVPGIVLAQCLNFLLLILVLRVIAFKPLLKVLEQRQERIAKGIEDARQAEARLANIEADYNKRMDEARIEGQKTVAELTVSAEKQAQAIIAKANEDVARLKAQVQEDALLERNKALVDLRTQVVALSMAAANKLVGEAMDAARQRALVDEFFSGVKAGKVVLLDPGVSAADVKAEVTSALPLSDSEQTSITSDLIGRGAREVEFKVDPRILGGLLVRVGDRVVDASVSGRLESLKQSLE
jgi:F-type H+-transporting ATPase subunit b